LRLVGGKFSFSEWLELSVFKDLNGVCKYFKLVDQAEIGTNTCYLVDFIQIQFSSKFLDPVEIRRLFLEKQLSAAQIAGQFQVSKAAILSILHRAGVRLGTKVGRSTNPENFRNNSPPYGYMVKAGKLVPNKAELKICRAVVELRGRRGFSTTEVGLALEKKGFKNRNGRTVWNSNTILNIFNRWNGKL
jgi:hypothetical protein